MPPPNTWLTPWRAAREGNPPPLMYSSVMRLNMGKSSLSPAGGGAAAADAVGDVGALSAPTADGERAAPTRRPGSSNPACARAGSSTLPEVNATATCNTALLKRTPEVTASQAGDAARRIREARVSLTARPEHTLLYLLYPSSPLALAWHTGYHWLPQQKGVMKSPNSCVALHAPRHPPAAPGCTCRSPAALSAGSNSRGHRAPAGGKGSLGLGLLPAVPIPEASGVRGCCCRGGVSTEGPVSAAPGARTAGGQERVPRPGPTTLLYCAAPRFVNWAFCWRGPHGGEGCRAKRGCCCEKAAAPATPASPISLALPIPLGLMRFPPSRGLPGVLPPLESLLLSAGLLLGFRWPPSIACLARAASPKCGMKPLGGGGGREGEAELSVLRRSSPSKSVSEE
eukprot:1153592-Pelagomonas_calceolata.AAC.7